MKLLSKNFTFGLSLLTLLLAIFDLGFDKGPDVQEVLQWLYMICLTVGAFSISAKYFSADKRPKSQVWLVHLVLVLLCAFLVFRHIGIWPAETAWGRAFQHMNWVYLVVFLIFVHELVYMEIHFRQVALNPAQLFILSFLALIAVGTALLSLPNATHTGISLIDALFTATSAVCVTGLIVVDTGSYFTQFGQSVVLLLIQLGGIGIMTFASYFSYFFRGGASYENQVMLRDMTSAEKLGEVFSTLKKIILITFSIEFVGALFIYFSLDKALFESFGEGVFFSVFHTISGFCNAGFSTLSDSLYEAAFRFNYPLHLIIAALFIVGGLGFPIVFNLIWYLKYLVVNKILPYSRKREMKTIPWVVNLNTRIVLITSLILTIVGTLLFYLFEFNNTLSEHNGLGKLVTAFFGAVTTRTAGFNTVDTSALAFSTTMIVFLLMWIGASPASTGGGIKTSTFAIATLNFIALARGKNRIEIYRRQIADISVRRAFAIIALSLLAIGAGVFFMASFDSEKELIDIAFESFSAYSTVGLSRGITGSLSSASKGVIIVLMFVGRVSFLTLLIAVMRKVKYQHYQYPSEEILIN